MGQPVHFIRFGGCDYRCTWCDSKFAVEPTQVRENSTMMSARDILDALASLEGSPRWVVLSGGNPALHRLNTLCTLLHESGYKITIETQGTVYNPWLNRLDSVTISPKPPSSGNVTTMEQVDAFRNRFNDHSKLSYKVVVFDERDIQYLRELVAHLGGRYPVFLSVGTDVENDVAADLLDKWRYWTERLATDDWLSDVRILAQCHVLLWGQKRGV